MTDFGAFERWVAIKSGSQYFPRLEGSREELQFSRKLMGSANGLEWLIGKLYPLERGIMLSGVLEKLIVRVQGTENSRNRLELSFNVTAAEFYVTQAL